MAGLLGFGQTVAPFLTSSTTALLTFSLLPESARSGLDWVTWALRAAPIYAIVLGGMFAFVLWRYSPRCSSSRLAALPVQRSILGPTSRNEWLVGIVTLGMLVSFATQPLHRVGAAWLAVGAVAVLAAFGLVTPETLRSINWNYALLFGTLASMVNVFAASGLDVALSHVLGGAIGALAGQPMVFVATLAVVAMAASFVLRFAALAPMLTVALAPAAASMGINPWVVAIVALVATSGFFLPYQNTTYQAIHQERDGTLFAHGHARPVAIAYGALILVGVCASVPVWRLMGLM